MYLQVMKDVTRNGQEYEEEASSKEKNAILLKNKTNLCQHIRIFEKAPKKKCF